VETGESARVKMIPEPPRWVRFPAQAVCTVNGIANVGWRLRHAWQYAYEAGWYRAISAPRMNRRAAFFYAYANGKLYFVQSVEIFFVPARSRSEAWQRHVERQATQPGRKKSGATPK